MCPKAYKTQSGLTNHTTTSHQLPGVLPGSATAPMSGGQSFVPTSTAMVAPPSPAAGPMAPPPTSAHSMVNMLNTMSTGGNSPTFAGMTTPQRSTSSSSLAAKLVATSSVVSQKMYTHKFQSPGVAAPSPTTGGAQQQQQGVSPATPGTQQQHQMSGGGQIISPPSSATGQQLMFAAPPPAQHSQMAMSTPTGGGLMQQQYQQSPPTTTNTGVPARAPFSSGGTTMLGGSQQQQQPGTGQSPQQQQQHSGPNIMQRKPVNKLYRHLPSTTGGGGGSGSPASGMYTSGTPQSMAGVMQQPSAITTKRYTSARPYTNVVRHVTVQQQQQQPQQHPMPPIAGGAGGKPCFMQNVFDGYREMIAHFQAYINLRQKQLQRVIEMPKKADKADDVRWGSNFWSFCKKNRRFCCSSSSNSEGEDVDDVSLSSSDDSSLDGRSPAGIADHASNLQKPKSTRWRTRVVKVSKLFNQSWKKSGKHFNRN
ncbi:unnamed protein product [Sphagnum balticum]